MTRETQQTVYDWSLATFGTPFSLRSTLLRASKEMTELLEAIEHGLSKDKIVGEAADVVIVLYRAASFGGVTLTWDTEWPASGMTAAADAANVMLARLIGGFSGTADMNATGDTYRRQRASDLHWIASHMARICNFCGTSLEVAVDNKMLINRERTFVVDAFGHGKHVSSRTEAPADAYSALAQAWGCSRNEAKTRFLSATLAPYDECAVTPVQELRERGPYGPGETARVFAAANGCPA